MKFYTTLTWSPRANSSFYRKYKLSTFSPTSAPLLTENHTLSLPRNEKLVLFSRFLFLTSVGDHAVFFYETTISKMSCTYSMLLKLYSLLINSVRTSSSLTANVAYIQEDNVFTYFCFCLSLNSASIHIQAVCSQYTFWIILIYLLNRFTLAVQIIFFMSRLFKGFYLILLDS